MKYYIRYTDDFVIVHSDKNCLKQLIPQIQSFLQDNLKLNLHPRKIIIRNYIQGIDFLGYVVLPYYRVLRTKTKRRMFKKIIEKMENYKKGEISKKVLEQTIQSYFGILKHCHSEKIKKDLRKYLF